MNLDLEGLAAALRPLVFRLYFVVRRETPQHQLTLAQGAVLSELANSGPCRMGHLADTAGVRLPSMTDVVGRMERLGLVVRRPDQRDRRVVLVHLTEDGRRLYADLITAREKFLRGQLAELTSADRDSIESAIPALWRLLRVPAEFDRGTTADQDRDQESTPPAGKEVVSAQ